MEYFLLFLPDVGGAGSHWGDWDSGSDLLESFVEHINTVEGVMSWRMILFHDTKFQFPNLET